MRLGRKGAIFNDSSKVIVCEDSPEATLEGNGDMLTPYQLDTSANGGYDYKTLDGLVWKKNSAGNLQQWSGGVRSLLSSGCG